MTQPYDSFNGQLPFAFDLFESNPSKKAPMPKNSGAYDPLLDVPKSPAKSFKPASGEFDSHDPETFAGKPLTGRCYETHPRVKLLAGTFVGGSCLNPICMDADIYIGFERNMAVKDFSPGPQAEYLSYPIPDGGVPKNPARFAQLIAHAKAALAAGKTVHAGCIGGHGRTGMFLAALYAEVTGEKDAITKVRELYCKKAVETQAQVDFLQKHYGITPAASSRASHSGVSDWGWGKKPSQYKSPSSKAPEPYPSLQGSGFSKAEQSWTPVPSKRNIFNARL